MKKIPKSIKLRIRLKMRMFELFYKLTGHKVIVDITGIILTPGENGYGCKGNGAHYSIFGKQIECCCDECDYLQCCFQLDKTNNCKECNSFCPHNKR